MTGRTHQRNSAPLSVAVAAVVVTAASLLIANCGRSQEPASGGTASPAASATSAASAASAASATTSSAAPASGSQPAGATGPAIQPVLATGTVPNDPDDPAIWVHPSDPGRSLILATDKIEQQGGLYVFGLDGKLRQRIAPLDRPNNVDVEYGVTLGGRQVDIAVVTERMQHRLRIFEIRREGGPLVDLAPRGIPVLAGQQGDEAEPMGVALYKRQGDGVTFAIVAPKTGGTTNYLWQYRLDADPSGAPTGTLVRRFGNFSRKGAAPGEIGEIEAVVADDELGYVYYSDEQFGIRKWHADPDHADAARELAVFGTSGYLGDREGIAIYRTPGMPGTPETQGATGSVDLRTGAGTRTGFIVSSDQVEGGTRVILYPREGAPGRPHEHVAIATRQTVSDETDGLDVTAQPLPGFPRGLLVMMNSAKRNFLIYRWEDVAPAPGS